LKKVVGVQRHNIRVVNEYGFAVPNPRRHE